jgi:adenylate kinase
MREFQEYCTRRGQPISFFDMGSHILNIAKEQGLPLTTEKILDVDEKVLKLMRALALERITRELEKSPGPSFITIHACFRWRGLLLPGFDFNNLDRLRPDIYINIVDNLDDIKRRMQENPQWKDKLNLNEINVWLDEEKFITQILAERYNKPYYLVSRQHPLDNFYDLIFSNKKKVYLSYPITHIEREFPEKIDKIREFGNYLRKYLVLFDPLDIKDTDLLLKQSDEEGQKIEYIDKTEAEKIETRTIDRDYQFIYQSDMIIVLYPTEYLSPGVLSEMNFAHRYNKDVYAVFPYNPSPFFSRLCTQIFKNTGELVENFKKLGIIPAGEVAAPILGF